MVLLEHDQDAVLHQKWFVQVGAVTLKSCETNADSFLGRFRPVSVVGCGLYNVSTAMSVMEMGKTKSQP